MRLEEQIVKARAQGLLVDEVGSELVVYDLETDAAHLLSESVTAIWRAIDGSRRVADLWGHIDAPADQAELVVWEALRQLDEQNLLATPLLFPSGGLTRRQMLKRIAIGAVAIPIITSIVAPTPAAAFTCGGSCNLSLGQLCPGETAAGSGNCRCAAESGPSQCQPCLGTNALVTNSPLVNCPRLCCTNSGTCGGGTNLNRCP